MSEPGRAGAFGLGVNYWPASQAMSFWQRWSEAEVASDFAKIKSVGLDSVRLFLMWEDFQKNPSGVEPQMLSRLVSTMDRAADAGLKVMPTLFTGHMSGANWLPGWSLASTGAEGRFRIVSGGRVVRADLINWYEDEALRGAQVKLARACAGALRGHQALLAWDLGNENSNCVVPESKESARAWLGALTSALRAGDSAAQVTIGIHMEDLEEERQLGPQEAAESCDFLTMHGYPGYASFSDGPTDERLLPFLTQLTRFLGGGKDVFFTEFGVPTHPVSSESVPPPSERIGEPQLVSEDTAAAYVGRSLAALHECGALGAMMWCYSDYSPELFDSPPFDMAPHERTFGLFRHDGTEKPAARVVREFAGRREVVSGPPHHPQAGFIDVAQADYYLAPREHLGRLFRRYCANLEGGSGVSETHSEHS
jgi:endo-1,4-beta-mannosidase